MSGGYRFVDSVSNRFSGKEGGLRAYGKGVRVESLGCRGCQKRKKHVG